MTGAANSDDVATRVLAPAEASHRLADAPREISGAGRSLLRQAQTHVPLGALVTVIE